MDELELRSIIHRKQTKLTHSMTKEEVFNLLNPELQQNLIKENKEVGYDGYMGCWVISNSTDGNGFACGTCYFITDEHLRKNGRD